MNIYSSEAQEGQKWRKAHERQNSGSQVARVEAQAWKSEPLGATYLDLRGRTMEGVSIRLRKSIFPLAAVTRTCHRYSGDFRVDISESEDDWLIDLLPAANASSTETVEARFRNDALDDLLRLQVQEQSRGVAEALLRAALQPIDGHR